MARYVSHLKKRGDLSRHVQNLIIIIIIITTTTILSMDRIHNHLGGTNNFGGMLILHSFAKQPAS